MEHLPPSGWTDVARKHDITLLEHEIILVKEEVGRIERRLNILIVSTLTFGLAITAVQVQIMLSIANL